MSERTYYVMCEDNCRFESMTKEQIIAAIAEATGNTPTHVDDAFITKLKEMNSNQNFSVWIGTTAEYNAIPAAERVQNRLYILTDEDVIDSAIDSLSAAIDEIISGELIVAEATHAESAESATKLLNGEQIDVSSGGANITECGMYLCVIRVSDEEGSQYTELVAITDLRFNVSGRSVKIDSDGHYGGVSYNANLHLLAPYKTGGNNDVYLDSCFKIMSFS